MSEYKIINARGPETGIETENQNIPAVESPLYFAPDTVDETTRLLAEYGREAKVLAGGLDVVG